MSNSIQELITLLKQENVPFLPFWHPKTGKYTVSYYGSIKPSGGPLCMIHEEDGVFCISGTLIPTDIAPLYASEIALILHDHWTAEVEKLLPSREDWITDYAQAEKQYQLYMDTRYGRRASHAGSYQEIKLLHTLLEEAGIPHDFRWYSPYTDGYQILYIGCGPYADQNSVIQTPRSKGQEYDLLEIHGDAITQSEYGETIGWLTAREVFRRILADWRKGR